MCLADTVTSAYEVQDAGDVTQHDGITPVGAELQVLGISAPQRRGRVEHWAHHTDLPLCQRPEQPASKVAVLCALVHRPGEDTAGRLLSGAGLRAESEAAGQALPRIRFRLVLQTGH